jgi:hypothetical protein
MKTYFKIATSIVFLLSAFQGIAQTDDKPVLAKHTKASKPENTTDSHVLAKNALSVTMSKSTMDSLQQVNPPQLKRSSGRKMNKETQDGK